MSELSYPGPAMSRSEQEDCDAAEEAFVASVIPAIRRLRSGRGRIIDAATQAMGGAGLVGSWVSVEKRLPDPRDEVLVWLSDKLTPCAAVGALDAHGVWWVEHEMEFGVTHWARIREPKS